MAGFLSNPQAWGNGLSALGGALLTLGARPEDRSQVGMQSLGNFQNMMMDQRRQKERDFLLNLEISDRARANQEREEAKRKQQEQEQAYKALLGGQAPANGMSQAQFGGAPQQPGPLGNLNDAQRQFLQAAGPQAGMGVIGQQLFQEPQGPNSSIAKASQDLMNGLIDKPTYDAIVKKETYIAPQTQPQAPDLPSSVREWQYFNGLSPEQQQQYLVMKRAADWQNLGGSVMLPNPLDPAGAPVADIAKTIPPQDTPEVRGAQATAVETAKAGVDAAAAADKKAGEAATTLEILNGIEDMIDKATGSYLGAARDVGAAAFGSATEGAKAIAQLKVIQSKLMLSMPRMEGPQSDRDVDLYREAAGQIGDPTIPGDIKKAAVETIRALQSKYPEAGQGSIRSKYGLEE